MLENPPVVTPTGDIQIHNQGAVEIVMGFTDLAGAARNVSTRSMVFEVSNGHRVTLTNGATTDQKILTIGQHDLDDLLGVVSSFVVVDETDPNHVVEWQGNILVTGWVG